MVTMIIVVVYCLDLFQDFIRSRYLKTDRMVFVDDFVLNTTLFGIIGTFFFQIKSLFEIAIM